jgi:hypothetical protein
MIEAQQTFRRTLEGVQSWIPAKAYGHESKFQNDLQEFLNTYLNDGSGGMGLGMGMQHNYVVQRERGKARGDVVVDDVVGIELKRDLSNDQVNTLRGQIGNYMDSYPFVIVCACGIDDMDGWRSLKNRYERMGGGMLGESAVTFVHKEKARYGGEPDVGVGRDPIGEDLYWP